MTNADMQDIEWLAWLDSDLLTGDGIIEEILPECFVVGEDGIEHVAFGKIISWEGGPDNLLPVPKALSEKIMKAAEEMPAEALFLETADENVKPEKYWRDFFEQNFKYIKSRLASLDQSIKEANLDLRYAASLIMPDASLSMGNDYHSDFDVLEYMNVKGYQDTEDRKKLAHDLDDLAQKNSSQKLSDHKEIITKALKYFA